jgi:anti-sigma regulatory factor (Ser/Thr protein kinase)
MDRAIPQVGATTRTFTQLLSATPRSARLARLLAVAALRSWSVPADLTERAELVVAELATNAVLHGSRPGRCFRLTLVHDAPTGRLRIEVRDARGDRLPLPRAADAAADPLSSGGRGLSLVAALTDSWDAVPHADGGKTVRATLSTQP